MTRWDWTWEDRPRTNRTPRSEDDPPADERERDSGTSGGARAGAGSDEVFRRRRAGAGLALIVLVVVLTGVIASHKSSAHPQASSAKSHVAPLSPTQAERAADAAKAEQRAIDSVLAYTPAVTSGGSSANEVALTFDDGPGPYTRQLVSTLNTLHVHATFFAVGNQEQYFSQGTVDEINSGDVVGDHTETHPMMSSLSAHDQYEQLFGQMAQIEIVGGPRPRLFRPPYGSFDATTLRELRHLHLLMILWSVDTADYTQPGIETIVRRALAGAKPGAIILMHDAGGNRSQTIAALPAIVRGLHKRGLRPVTIPRLLLDDPPPHGQPIPRSLTGG